MPELIISDSNYLSHALPPLGHAMGLIPRDYGAFPTGTIPGLPALRAVNMPLIPQDEWAARLKDLEDAKARLSDLRKIGNNGQPIPSLDQNGQGFCWAYSTGSAMTLVRAKNNLPYKRFSPHATACKIKGFRDEGGWGALSAKFAIDVGYLTVDVWPEKSMSRAYDTPENWAKAIKVTDSWLDLDAAAYDAKLAWQQQGTVLLSCCPEVGDYNWWSHSVCGMDLVNGVTQWGSTRDAVTGKLLSLQEFDTLWGMANPITRGFGKRIWNSWTDTWSEQGTGVLTGNKAIADGGCCILSVVPVF